VLGLRAEQPSKGNKIAQAILVRLRHVTDLVALETNLLYRKFGSNAVRWADIAMD